MTNHAETSKVSDVVNFYDTVARSDSSTSLAQRCQARIVYMRNFNNWIKSMLISSSLDQLHSNDTNADHHSSGIRVLDFCCGKGGDQQKWLVGGVSHVTFIDISPDSIQVCQQRYRQLCHRNNRIYSAHFGVWDCTKRLPPDLTKFGPFDLVSCQFAIHYAFESLLQVRTMLTNISDCLRPGGLFIATFPNAHELVRRACSALDVARKSVNPLSLPGHAINETVSNSKDGIKFGNSIYSVEFPTSSYTLKTPPDQDGCAAVDSPHRSIVFPLLGAQYNFRLEGVVDCPEFLVYPSLLVTVAKELNLTAVSTPFGQMTSFPDYCYYRLTSQTSSSGDTLQLLARMNALEAIQNPFVSDSAKDDRRVSLCTNHTKFDTDAYAHVEKRVEEDESLHHSHFVGTLSNLEWEVISLYSIISFIRD